MSSAQSHPSLPQTGEPLSYGNANQAQLPEQEQPSREGCCARECDNCPSRTQKSILDDFKAIDTYWKHCGAEIKEEFTFERKTKEECDAICLAGVKSWVHVPFFPAFHRPGWMLRYVIGPFDDEWVQSILADIVAGITVALLLIPQVRNQYSSYIFIEPL